LAITLPYPFHLFQIFCDENQAGIQDDALLRSSTVSGEQGFTDIESMSPRLSFLEEELFDAVPNIQSEGEKRKSVKALKVKDTASAKKMRRVLPPINSIFDLRGAKELVDDVSPPAPVTCVVLLIYIYFPHKNNLFL